MPWPALRTVFLILGLVMAPTQASAVCAWILWTKLTMSEVDGKARLIDVRWEPTGFDSLKECEAARGRWLDRTAKANETIEGKGDAYLVITKREKEATFVTLLGAKCLPDTVDPNRQ